MSNKYLISGIGVAAIAGTLAAIMLFTDNRPNFKAVEKRGDGGVVLTDLSPGDTAYFPLSGSPYSWVYVSGSGAPGKPIVLTAEPGVIFRAGFAIENARYYKFRGLHVNQGWIQNNNGVAFDIKGRSSNLEFEHCKVDSSGYGSWLKNESFCDASLSDWVLDSISFHHYEMTNLNQHGFYWGPTEAVNKTRPVNCNGVEQFYNPSRLGNIRIHDGVIRDVGKNGIMLSCASTGKSEVYANSITNTGLQLVPEQNQGTGIAIGAFSNVAVWGNTVDSTWLWGIACFEPTAVEITMNRVKNWGTNSLGRLAWPSSIFVRNAANSVLGCNLGPSGTLLDVPDNKPCVDQPPLPPPTKTVFHKGYWIKNNKRFYYTIYVSGTDSTWSNKK